MRKKSQFSPHRTSPGGREGYSLETFHQRLRDFCADHLSRAGGDRPSITKDQAQQACALASELGILKHAGRSWEDFKSSARELHFGTEYLVEFDELRKEVIKITRPPAFGLTPCVVSHPVVNLRDDPSLPAFRQVIEFHPGTPLEYLERWIAANEVFGDDVSLASVIHWADGQVSFAITQPQYHGEPASDRDINRIFESAGWKRLTDASGHTLYFNYAFQILAIDALPRNCYIHDDELLPFDVILCRPNEELEKLLHFPHSPAFIQPAFASTFSSGDPRVIVLSPQLRRPSHVARRPSASLHPLSHRLCTSHRLKGEPNGFHIIDTTPHAMTIQAHTWKDTKYQPMQQWHFERNSGRDWQPV